MAVTLKQVRSLQNRTVTLTTAKVLKGIKGKPAVIKHSRYRAVMGSDLETLDLPWGQWIDAGLILTHNNQVYIRCSRVEDPQAEVYYTLTNNDLIDESLARTYCSLGEFDKLPVSEGIFNIKLMNIDEVA